VTPIPRIWRASARITAAFALALVVTLGLAVAPAAAGMGPVAWQATGGWYTDHGDFFVGAGARFGLASITVIPNAEYVFINGGSTYTLNVDGTLNVLPLGVATGYVGAGLGLYIVDPDAGDSNTDSAVNLIAGAGLNAIKFKPFAQLKLVVKDGDDPLELAFGIRF
jgi:hypothetical protein